jgi:hypothetical protein
VKVKIACQSGHAFLARNFSDKKKREALEIYTPKNTYIFSLAATSPKFFSSHL